jgi:hypothetical protein
MVQRTSGIGIKTCNMGSERKHGPTDPHTGEIFRAERSMARADSCGQMEASIMVNLASFSGIDCLKLA